MPVSGRKGKWRGKARKARKGGKEEDVELRERKDKWR